MTEAPKYPEIGSKAWGFEITAPREGKIIDDANDGVLFDSKHFAFSLCGPPEAFCATELAAWRQYMAELLAEVVVAKNQIERLENAAKETHQ